MIQNKTTSRNQAWNQNLRARVGDVVTHDGKTWTNQNGKNSEPGVGFDWSLSVGEENQVLNESLITVNGNPFKLVKNPNNVSANLEVNDTIQNGYWDNDEIWLAARFLGVDKDVKANWQVLNGIEEVPID